MKTTKRSLLASGLCLVLSVALLMGATFAWFTDSVTNQGNTIQAGNLDVGFQYRGLTSSDAYQDVPTQGTDMGKLFVTENWEPGRSQGLDLKVTNNGSLALEWELSLQIQNETGDANIADALEVYITSDNAIDLQGATYVGTLSKLTEGAVKVGTLVKQGDSEAFSVVLKMSEDAGNDYQNCTVSFDVTLRANQAVSESDGFGNSDYDAAADGTPDYPEWGDIFTGTVTAPVVPGEDTKLVAGDNSVVVTVPTGAALKEGVDELYLTVGKNSTPDSITIKDGQKAKTYDISVEGLADSNTVPVPVQLDLGTDLRHVSLYHNGQPMESSYDAATGLLTFETASFGLFTVVYETPEVTSADQLIDALQEGGLVILNADVTTNELVAVPEGVTAVLDLNGHKIDSTRDGYAMENKGTLTINDGKGTGIVCHTGTEVATNYGHDSIRNFGTLIINGGTFGDCDMDQSNANPDNRGASVRNQSGGVCTINGGYFTCGDNYWAWGTGTGYSYAIRNMGTMTINDATLYGAMNGGIASEEFGTLTINGGRFSVTGPKSYYVLVTGGLGTIEVNDGSFIKTGGNGGLLGGFSGMPSWDASEDLKENGYTINGGTFTRDGETVTLN